jgi:hypothetical protein
VLEVDYAFLVHNERGSFGESTLPQDAVGLRHISVRPEVAQQENVLYPQRLGPGPIGVRTVDANTQNLGIFLLESLYVSVQGGNLLTSDGGPGQRIEGDNDVALPLEVTQSNVATGMIGKSEIGCFIADLQLGISDLTSVGRPEQRHASDSPQYADNQCYGEETVVG